MSATTTTTATASPLSDADQAWLDATPFGDRREITRDGATFTVDRRAAPSEPMHNPWPRYAPSVAGISGPPAVTEEDRMRAMIDAMFSVEIERLLAPRIN